MPMTGHPKTGSSGVVLKRLAAKGRSKRPAVNSPSAPGPTQAMDSGAIILRSHRPDLSGLCAPKRFIYLNDTSEAYPIQAFDLDEHQVLKLGWEKTEFIKGLTKNMCYTGRVILKTNSTVEKVASWDPDVDGYLVSQAFVNE